MAIDYSGLISEGGRAALSSLKNMPPDQQRAKMNDMLANGLLPFSVAMAVDKQLRQPLKENAPSPRPGSVMEEKLNLLNKVQGGGIDQLPAPDMQQAQFAGGGIVAFAGDEGSLVGEPDPFAGLAGMKPTDKRYSVMQYFKNIYDRNKKQPDEDEIGREIDTRQQTGKYGKYSQAANDYENILKGREKGIDEAGDERKARRAGWLAMAQAGAEGKGLLAGATAGFSKYGDISDAREEKRKTELRELQKEQYTLQLGREQAAAANDKERVSRYDAALDRNIKAQEIVGRGVMSLEEMESRERTADKDRAVQGNKDLINVEYYRRRRALETKLISATPSEAAAIKTEIDALDADWRKVNENVGAASVYGANQRQDAAEVGALKALFGDSFNQAVALANSAKLALQKKPGDPNLMAKYLDAQSQVDAMIAQIRGAGGGAAPSGTQPAEAALADGAPNGKYAQ
jgi:hypothetical protein